MPSSSSCPRRTRWSGGCWRRAATSSPTTRSTASGRPPPSASRSSAKRPSRRARGCCSCSSVAATAAGPTVDTTRPVLAQARQPVGDVRQIVRVGPVARRIDPVGQELVVEREVAAEERREGVDGGHRREETEVLAARDVPGIEDPVFLLELLLGGTGGPVGV